MAWRHAEERSAVLMSLSLSECMDEIATHMRERDLIDRAEGQRRASGLLPIAKERGAVLVTTQATPSHRGQ